MSRFNINVQPDSMELWRGFGKNHFNFTSLLCELIDNSISNFLANQDLPLKEIRITLEKLMIDNKVRVSIEDTGTGIENFTDAFNLGTKNRATKTDSFLNEHGFGLKNALATANPENDNWKVFSRTKKDFKDNLINVVEAPWKMTFNQERFEGKSLKEKWPGEFNSKGGTYIEFTCPDDLFNSISKRGSRFTLKTSHLVEEISVIYRPFLKNCNIKILEIQNRTKTTHEIKPITPNNATLIEKSKPQQILENPVTFKVNDNNVEVECEFYRYPNDDDCENRYKYYKHNIKTFGCEIRVNGRLLAYPLFEEIWDLKRNGVYNSFWGVVNITGKREHLPVTSTTKTGLQENDSLYKEILSKISEIFPEQFLPNSQKEKGGSGGSGGSGGRSEAEKQKELIGKLEKWQKAKTATHPYQVFKNIQHDIGELDLYMVNEKSEVVLCELKKDRSKLLNIYQLLMYWDGYVYDKDKSPSKAILIASDHQDWAQDVVNEINLQTDSKGMNYNIELKTWKDFDVE